MGIARIKKNITISDLTDREFFINLPNDLIVLPTFESKDTLDKIDEEISDIDISEKNIDKIYIETWSALPKKYKDVFENVFLIYATWLDMLPDDDFEIYMNYITNKNLPKNFISDNSEYKSIMTLYNANGKNIDKLIAEIYSELIKPVPKKNAALLTDVFNIIDNNIMKSETITMITDDNIVLAALADSDLLKLKAQTFLYSEFKSRNLVYELNNKNIYISVLELNNKL